MQMAIADDDLRVRVRPPDPVEDDQPSDDALERCGSIRRPAHRPHRRPIDADGWYRRHGCSDKRRVAGFAVWPSGGEPSAAALVRDAAAASMSSLPSGRSEKRSSRAWNEAWSIRVDGDDAAFVSRAVSQGRNEESAVTYLGDAVYVTAQGQTEIRSRVTADRIDRFHELFAALNAALDGADVTEASTETVAGVEMTRYYVGLTEQSIASLSAGRAADLIADPGDLEELRVCVADAHHVHEVHFVYRDGRTIDVSLVNVNGNITVRPPDGPYVG